MGFTKNSSYVSSKKKIKAYIMHKICITQLKTNTQKFLKSLKYLKRGQAGVL